MTATVTIRLIELELSAGAYDGSKIDGSQSGYVEVNQTYTNIGIANSIELTGTEDADFIKRILSYVFGTPDPTAYIPGKEQR